MQQSHLFPKIRSEVSFLLNRYISSTKLEDEMDNYICPPLLGGKSGIFGAMALALQKIGAYPV